MDVLLFLNLLQDLEVMLDVPCSPRHLLHIGLACPKLQRLIIHSVLSVAALADNNYDRPLFPELKRLTVLS